MSTETIVVLILGILFFGGIGFLIWASRSSEGERRADEGHVGGRKDRVAASGTPNPKGAGRGRD